jgi:hypothetical protein
MTTLKLTIIVLPIVEILVFILILIFKDRKRKEDPVPDDEPIYCEDFERPFYNP